MSIQTPHHERHLDDISVMLRQSVKLLVSTVKHMRHPNQLLLIPLTIWSGLEQSFLGAQFTKVESQRMGDENDCTASCTPRVSSRARSTPNTSAWS